MAGATGFTLWHYKTIDVIVEETGYFNPASDMLRVGDIIIFSNLSGVGRLSTKIYTVTANISNVVTIAEYNGVFYLKSYIYCMNLLMTVRSSNNADFNLFQYTFP